jgi:hypothetical protein
MSGAIPPHSHKPLRWVTPLVVELARGNLGSNLALRLPRKPKRAKELPPLAKLMLMHAVCELLVRNSTFVETDRTAGSRGSRPGGMWGGASQFQECGQETPSCSELKNLVKTRRVRRS